MSSKKLRVALIGCGRMGMHHVRAIELQELAEVCAIADPHVDADKLEKITGRKIEIFSDAQEMLSKVKPDVVHIVTPPETHFELAKLALNNGAHIYVEKPFALNVQDAQAVINLAEEKGLKACAAHQVLFQDSGRKFRNFMPLIRDVIHVESYFSFKTVRRAGSGLMSPVEQLEDILPHPVYLLLSAFESDNGKSRIEDCELISYEVDPKGEVRAFIRNKNSIATLIVTLQGRPIESYLRIVGTNGSINADFVLSGVTKILGPGSSAISAVLQPFSEARQKVFGTIGSIFRLIFKKHKSYAGLSELIEGFYKSVVSNANLPLSYQSITRTVEICEVIGDSLRRMADENEKAAEALLLEAEGKLDKPVQGRSVVLVTGGTGFLGREFVKEIRGRGWPVRVIARKLPLFARRIPGVEYVKGDIAVAADINDKFFDGVELVAHLAAETAGGKEEHERNTIGATQNMVDASIKNKIKKFINISSIAVHKPSSTIGGPINENSPIDMDNLGRGPYVWAKAKAERLVSDELSKHGIQFKTIRLGPLVDFDNFTPPGRLGREVGTLFVAMGNPGSMLSVCDVKTASNVLRSYVEDFESAPKELNLVEAPAPKRRELVKMLKATRPEIRVMWMPAPILKMISISLKGVLKLKSPSKKPLDLYAAFASEKYDSTLAAETIKRARS